MKPILLFTLTLLSLRFEAQELNVMTFNIRYNTSRDSINAWPNRKEFAAGQVLFHQVHLLGVQEALHDQIVDLQQRLKQYRYVGVGRSDGKENGEYSAIFYDTTRLRLIESKTFWLSETPDSIGKKGWDAAIERIVTWARFRDRKTGKEFYHFNTHFDHIGKMARRESARLLIDKVAAIAKNTPAVVTGDFNAHPADEPIRIIVDSSSKNRLTDAKAVSILPHYGPVGTFNGFGSRERDSQPIDYIFIKNGFKVLRHATLSQSLEGRFSSDHFPVFATLQL
jgi:endonuclease/exonuclease/phosphatase family metal-dependent hydrolase